jgi:nucleotide-binding universal stress UspA family protein
VRRVDVIVVARPHAGIGGARVARCGLAVPARREPAGAGRREEPDGTAPARRYAAAMTPGPFHHVGCCVDGTPAAQVAIAHARDLWTPGDGVLSIVHVAPRPLIMETVDGEEVPSPRDISSRERIWLEGLAKGVPGAEPVLLGGLPGPEICRWAAAAGVDVLVCARHHGPVGSVVLGSVARHLVDHAPCPVLVVRQNAGQARTATSEAVS